MISPYRALDRAAFGVFAFLSGLLCMAEKAMADTGTGLGTMATTLKTNIAQFGPAIKTGILVGGIMLMGLGLWQLYQKSQQPGQPKGGAIIAIFIGAIMLGITAFTQMMGSTLSNTVETENFNGGN